MTPHVPFLVLLGAAVAGLGALVAGPRPERPWLVVNTSASEPPGLYWRSARSPSVGERIAFRPPEPGRAYVRDHMPQIGRGGILKTVVAGQGARACVAGDQLRVAGHRPAPIAVRGSSGAALPRWRGCLTLERDQWLVLSTRIPNSFDSRYYGPVPQADVIGVYRPLWLWEAAPGGAGRS
ncbi:S26 family signal peptidase [Caulobacter segnis]